MVIKCRASVTFESEFGIMVPEDISEYGTLDELIEAAEDEACSVLPDEIGDNRLMWEINWDTLRFYERKRGN